MTFKNWNSYWWLKIEFTGTQRKRILYTVYKYVCKLYSCLVQGLESLFCSSLCFWRLLGLEGHFAFNGLQYCIHFWHDPPLSCKPISLTSPCTKEQAYQHDLCSQVCTQCPKKQLLLGNPLCSYCTAPCNLQVWGLLREHRFHLSSGALQSSLK